MFDLDAVGGKIGLRFGAKNFTVLGDSGFELNNGVCLAANGDVALFVGDVAPGDGERSSLLRNSANCCMFVKLLTYELWPMSLCSLLTGLGGGVRTAPSGRRLVLMTSCRRSFVSRLFKSYTRVVSESSLSVRLSSCGVVVWLVLGVDDLLFTMVLLDEVSVDRLFESDSSMNTGLAVKISMESGNLSVAFESILFDICNYLFNYYCHRRP